MADLWVGPSFGFKIIDEQVVELQNEVPSSENKELILLGDQTGEMAASRLRWISFGFGFFPLKRVKVQFVEIIEGSALVVHTSLTPENDNFILVVGHRVVGTWLRSAYLAHCVFGRPLGFLVGWLEPLKSG